MRFANNISTFAFVTSGYCEWEKWGTHTQTQKHTFEPATFFALSVFDIEFTGVQSMLS